MIRRILAPLIFGIAGAAVLTALGVWQLQRLAWKEGVLAEIEARIAAEPVDLPASLDPDADRYLPVRAEGQFAGDTLRVLVSMRGAGAGYRLITPFETGGRVILIDRGFLPVAADTASPPAGLVTVSGNLHWPDEVDGFTPEADIAENIWFARDVPAMAAHLGTDPILIIARSVSGDDAMLPLPVTTEGIPNNHLGYAIQWFGLALVWLGMTGFLVWRITRRTG